MDAEAFVACADTFFRTFAHANDVPYAACRLQDRCCRQSRGVKMVRVARLRLLKVRTTSSELDYQLVQI